MKSKKGESTMIERRQRRTYTKEFKNQIVKLHDTRKSRAAIIQEDNLSPSSFDAWLKQNSFIKNSLRVLIT